MKQLKRLSKGQGLVEFALLLPFLLMLLLGVFEFGRILVIYSSLYNAVREGTRYGITNPRDYEGIRGRALEYVILIGQNDPDFNLWVQYDDGPGGILHTDYLSVAAGDRVVVQIQYPVRPITPLFDPLVGVIMLNTQAARTIQSVGTVITTPPPAGPTPPGGGPTPPPGDPGDGDGAATATPTGPYFVASQTCYPLGSQTIILYAYNWPTGNYIQVFYDNGATPVVRDYGKIGSPNFSVNFLANVTAGTHTIRMDATNQKHPDTAVATHTFTFVSPCPAATPTATPTVTPTPEPGQPTPTPTPINIDKPVLAGATTVAGQAQTGNTVTLRVVQTGYQQSVQVGAGNRFSFSGVPGLLAGYTIIVQGYGQQDLAVVQAVATPTPTPTPLPTGYYFTLDQPCYALGNQNFTISIRNWPGNYYYMVYYDNALETSSGQKVSTVNYNIALTNMNVTAGTHTIRVDAVNNKNQPDVVAGTYNVTFNAPCAVTPSPTPTPVHRPDLTITHIALKEPLTNGTYEPIYLSVAVKNNSDVAVSSLFWVDLFDTADPTTRTMSVDYVAIAGLPAQETITFTMYVLEGFSTLGDHVLMAEVDRYGVILESDETNNRSQVLPVTLTVENPAPEPTPTPAPGNGIIDGFTYLSQTLQSNVFVVVKDDIGRPVGSAFSNASGYYVITGLAACPDVAPCYTVEGSLRLGDKRYEDIKIAAPGDTVLLVLKAMGN